MGIKNCLLPVGGKYILEVDYSQLEIRILALATGDPQLMEDLINGVDLHRHFASEIFSIPEAHVTSEQRKVAKGFSFQLQFGASARGIAAFWNVEVALAKKFIAAYYSRYPRVKEWQDENIRTVIDRGKFEGATVQQHGATLSVKTSTVPSIWTNPNWGSFSLDEVWYEGAANATFPSTKIKNYPIQGGAADIVLLMLEALRRDFLVRPYVLDKLFFSNTIHDSFLFRMPTNNYPTVIREVCEYLSNVNEVILKPVYGIDTDLPFPVEATIGKTWGDRKIVYCT
jgi:DNA polymerase I-like protein with 3'-5' exonuclease and polymerase domains